MKKILFAGLLAGLLFTSCSKENPFKVTPTQVGPLTKETPVSDLKTIFANDSVVDQNSGLSEELNINAIEVYEKGGKQLLSLMPIKEGDPKTIRTVQIFDPRYTTEAGINLNSTFKDLTDAYEISRIETLISSVVVFVDDINAYFTIDRKELQGELRFDMEAKVTEAEIPDAAKIKYFMIGW
ncbi:MULTISPECIES: hypothetical protein [unclassified Leeuwenhoekiella]|uniref:hypothetical protein n=1 Tax=unclassified Leeuwenhoekiella TaxID=2615029 RepID=UPI000C461860|nr:MULTISPECIES: hypothetical protein [unclassified Leeuwenhoekiella]MAW95724.1 hypothetical protein [Leeuwenhoekiella sp.]MBA81201.1 hypothetical protein [Leeuwenhoekiella sp.]|tara:strand:+ start:25258 stop:25803 length:546 start_codon:yes stop_codon:yes gene_type:complete